MNETKRNLAVGGFVVTSMVVLATLMAWFGETPEWLGGNEWTLEIVDVRELRGITQGSPVQFNGVEIGRVKDLRFTNPQRPDLGVVVLTGIKYQYSIPQGAIARLYGATLGFGSGRVEIIAEKGGEQLLLPKEGGTQIQGEMRSIVSEFITKDMVDSVQRTINNIGNLAGEATPVARNLATLLELRTVAEVDQPGGAQTANVATVVERLDDLVANLNMVLGDTTVQDDVKGVVRDVKAAAERLRETIDLWKSQTQRLADNLNSGINNTEANLDRSFTKLNGVLENLEDGSKSLALALHQVADGKGTAGLLVRDDRLYEAAVLSLQRFSDAMASLNAILGKIERDGYITVQAAKDPTGLLRKDYPTPAQAADVR